MEICVYCSSSKFIGSEFHNEAEVLGNLIAKYRHNLVYGGAKNGLMRTLADGAKQGMSKITAVISQQYSFKESSFSDADEVILTKNLRERKLTMNNLADAFIALPGGLGTLEEILEVIIQKKMRQHSKPVVLVNTKGYFNSLEPFLNHTFEANQLFEQDKKLFHLAVNCHEALGIIQKSNSTMTAVF